MNLGGCRHVEFILIVAFSFSNDTNGYLQESASREKG